MQTAGLISCMIQTQTQEGLACLQQSDVDMFVHLLMPSQLQHNFPLGLSQLSVLLCISSGPDSRLFHETAAGLYVRA